MRRKDAKRFGQLEAALIDYSNNTHTLPGIRPHENRFALIEQFIESIRRVEYVHVIRDKEHNPERTNPSSDLFDPLKAAVINHNNGNIDEACWLVFLAIHFGKHKSSGWRLTRNVYGALDNGVVWNWERVARNPDDIVNWLAENYEVLTKDGRFGNHRKYETLRPSSNKCTGTVIASYVRWVMEYGGHTGLFENAIDKSNGNARAAFRHLYDTMQVFRFGRTGKFDFLTMLAKLGLASIEADSPYLINATGPLRGAKLLFGGSVSSTKHSPRALEDLVVNLGDTLRVGMQEMEDALCNWQKSPGRFVRFRG